jgi:hypothetical protein
LNGEQVIMEKLAGEELGRSASHAHVCVCVSERERYEVSEIWRKKREKGGEIRTKRGWIRVTPSRQSEAFVDDATDVCLFGNVVSHRMCVEIRTYP